MGEGINYQTEDQQNQCTHVWQWIFCGIGGKVWAGAEVPGVPTTLLCGRLGLGVGVKAAPSWTAVALFVELNVLVGMALKGCGG